MPTISNQHESQAEASRDSPGNIARAFDVARVALFVESLGAVCASAQRATVHMQANQSDIRSDRILRGLL